MCRKGSRTHWLSLKRKPVLFSQECKQIYKKNKGKKGQEQERRELGGLGKKGVRGRWGN